MKKAWEIAKQGVAKFGGKVSEYISEALKIAWATLKSESGSIGPKTSEIRFPYCKKHWVAKITGADPKYKLARTFLESEEDGNDIVYRNLTDGYYQVSRFGKKGDYVKIENGVIQNVSEQEVMNFFNAPKHSINKKFRDYRTFVCWECGCTRPIHMKHEDGTCGC